MRLEVDTTESSGWSEIDAVRLLGKQRWEGGDASHVAHWAAFQESVRESASNSITIGGRGLSQRHSFPRSDPNASARRTAWGSNDAENQAPQSPSPSAGEIHLRKRVETLEQQVPTSPHRAPPHRAHCPFAMARIVLTAAVHVSQLCALRTEKVSSEGFKRGNGGEKEGAGMAPDCVICWEARANMVLVPCGHLCMCYECASSWARSMIKPAEVRGDMAEMQPRCGRGDR